MTLTRPLRIGLAYPGDPEAPEEWSGVPAGLVTALRSRGAVVEPLPAQPSRAMTWAAANVLPLLRLHRTPGASLRERARVGRTIGLYTSREIASLRSRALRPHVRRALPLDGVVQVWTSYRLPAGLRVATFEDMTVRQAVDLRYPEWTALSAREREAGIARQAEAYARAVACCFATSWAAESASRDYGVDGEKVHVVGVGRNHTPRAVARDWTTPRFLFVGGDFRRKNGDAVVRAFSRLREGVPAARLDLVGGHPPIDVGGVVGHGPRSLADPGHREQVDALFERATCFVMPSLIEPAGIAYVEAAAGGIPSIGSTVGGSRELIGDGGCVVDPGDEEALLAAMLRFADADEARETGERARLRADRFTWPAVAERMLDALGLG